MMGRFVKVNITRSSNGVTNKPPIRALNVGDMINKEMLLNKSMPITRNLSLYHGFSRITGLTIK